MTDRLLYTIAPNTTAPTDKESIDELSRVSLLVGLDVAGHGYLPKGSAGTVVSIYGGGEAYCVEFTQPFHALVTIDAEQITSILEATRAHFAAASRDVLHRSR